MWPRRLIFSFVISLAAWLVAGAIFCEGSLRIRRRPALGEPAREAALRRLAAGWDAVTLAAADGVALKAWFVSPPAPNGGCVLLLHGAATSRSSGLGPADMLLRAGYGVLMPDSRGHGESGGSIVTFGQLEQADVLRWAEWSRTRGCTRLFGLGASMGGVALIEAAASQPVFRAIVAECPYRDLRTTAEERVVLKLWLPGLVSRPIAKLLVPSASLYARLLYGLDLDSPAAIRSAAQLRTPLLLIHGLGDVKIPPAHSRAIAAVDRNASLWLVPGASHISASLAAPAEYSRRILDWFRRYSEP